MAEQDEKEVDESITLNIVHNFPPDVRLTFVDNILVQHTPTEFTITFAQVRQPIAQTVSDYETLESIPAEVVARIVLTPAKMREFMTSLQENWSIFQRRIKKLMETQHAAADSKASTNE